MSRKKGDDYAGVTAKDCCAGCTADLCMISEEDYCGHPYKGSHPTKPEVTARVEEVRKIIQRQKIDKAS